VTLKYHSYSQEKALKLSQGLSTNDVELEIKKSILSRADYVSSQVEVVKRVLKLFFSLPADEITQNIEEKGMREALPLLASNLLFPLIRCELTCDAACDCLLAVANQAIEPSLLHITRSVWVDICKKGKIK